MEPSTTLGYTSLPIDALVNALEIKEKIHTVLSNEQRRVKTACLSWQVVM
jgi:hypothetical protein